MTEAAIKSLADGQLGTTKATLYTTPAATQAVIDHIKLTNITPSMVKCNLYFKASGGTSRRIIPYDMELEAHASFKSDKEMLEAADIIEGDANSGSAIDYIIKGIENS